MLVKHLRGLLTMGSTSLRILVTQGRLSSRPPTCDRCPPAGLPLPSAEGLFSSQRGRKQPEAAVSAPSICTRSSSSLLLDEAHL